MSRPSRVFAGPLGALLLAAVLHAPAAAAAPQGGDADDCEDATSGVALKFCDAKRAQQQEQARDRALDRISRDWNARDRAAFARVRRRAEAFARSTSLNETDQVGTGRDMFMAEAYAEVKSNLERDVVNAERGRFPAYTAPDLAAADASLNRIYQAIMGSAPGARGQPAIVTGIGTAGIRETQRAWLKYRDAWVEFGAVRYPQVPAHAWKAMLTERRIRQLEDLQQDVGAGEGGGE